jgi:formylglycine-generating enzyme required for sulfatase activity
MCRAVDDLGQGRGNRPVSLVSFEDTQAYLKWLNAAARLADQNGKVRAGTNAYRLPDFPQWYRAAGGAARNADSRFGQFGDGKDAISPDMANYNWSLSFSNSQRATPPKQALPVGSFPPNSLGYFDLIGNLREWTRSCDGDITPTWPDTTAEQRHRAMSSDRQCKQRLVVGGSFDDHPRDLRTHARNEARELLVTGRLEDPDERNLRTGFRVVRTLQ